MKQPQQAQVFFWTMPPSYSSYYPLGAGLELSDVIIYSSSFRLFGDLLLVISVAIGTYSYIVVEPAEASKEIKKAKYLWIIAYSSLLIYNLNALPWLKMIPHPNLILLLTLSSIAYISVFTPEGILISHVQVQRAQNLYNSMVANKKKSSVGSIDRVYDYLQKLPDMEFEDN